MNSEILAQIDLENSQISTVDAVIMHSQALAFRMDIHIEMLPWFLSIALASRFQ